MMIGTVGKYKYPNAFPQCCNKHVKDIYWELVYNSTRQRALKEQDEYLISVTLLASTVEYFCKVASLDFFTSTAE